MCKITTNKPMYRYFKTQCRIIKSMKLIFGSAFFFLWAQGLNQFENEIKSVSILKSDLKFIVLQYSKVSVSFFFLFLNNRTYIHKALLFVVLLATDFRLAVTVYKKGPIVANKKKTLRSDKHEKDRRSVVAGIK